MTLLLASASPRRRELLGRLDLDLEVRPAAIDESVGEGETADAYVRRMARTKALALPSQLPVLAADTVVVLDGEVLPKPANASENATMIGRLAGRTHTVTTAVALATGGEVRELLAVSTEVRFRLLEAAEIAAYAATGEGLDKAGGYGIQGRGAALVTAITGSYTNVVGLPLAETLLLLRRHGVVS